MSGNYNDDIAGITFKQVLDRARSLDLTGTETLVLGVVMTEALQSLNAIAARLGMGRQTVKVALIRMRRLGCVRGDCRRRNLSAGL